MAAHAFGIYRGVVTDIKDPQGKRRLKATVPQLFGTDATEWAWPREDASTKVDLPSVGQGVWIMFEGGDLAFPVWVGTFGKVVGAGKHVLLKPVSTTPAPLVVTSSSDGVKSLDAGASLVALANAVEALTARVATLESQMPLALDNGL